MQPQTKKPACWSFYNWSCSPSMSLSTNAIFTCQLPISSKPPSHLSLGMMCHVPKIIVTSLEVGKGKAKQKIAKTVKYFLFISICDR